VIKCARQALALAVAGAWLAGCSGGTSAVPGANALSGANPSMALHSLVLAGPNASPIIKHVTPIQAEQYQKIVIKGTGFGKMKPYNGDSCCIQFVVSNPACYYYGDYGTWQAGYEGSGNEVTLDVVKWSNKKIILSGFTGLYGYSCWELVANQAITLHIWNAQNQSGPATWSGTIQ
jgi:hypothetical protein